MEQANLLQTAEQLKATLDKVHAGEVIFANKQMTVEFFADLRGGYFELFCAGKITKEQYDNARDEINWTELAHLKQFLES